jgi:hypothetical protein
LLAGDALCSHDQYFAGWEQIENVFGAFIEMSGLKEAKELLVGVVSEEIGTFCENSFLLQKKF